MTLPTVGIIGCGWLGIALASYLITNQYQVKVTVRTPEKQQVLQQAGFDCELLTMSADVTEPQADLPLAIFQQDILVIAITPGFKQGRKDYANNIQNIISQAEAGQVKKIILISSTGVYQGLHGQVDELTPLALTNEKSQILGQAEQAVVNFSGQGQVLRLAGLVAEDRKPGKFLAGKVGLAGGKSAVNLIHREDCIGLLAKLIAHDINQKIFVGVSQTKATKADFYQAAATALQLIPPSFTQDNETHDNRQVLGERTRDWLAYQYQYDDLLAWLAKS